ncbi:hypothetical protein [Ectothiorhodospira lacustris]|uniref:hypothetical protein n=1 Tax=Ectothiorhodospira lacustris TaxID=2899127 RepID=UPI001EE79FFC|nr:hypothetical protein [Ectothiorhodospira lacustris]MCG5502222.1 hypothetical protein [Ectothiorhodospira lacustris]
MVSDFKPAREGAENLKTLLEQELPGICIYRTDSDLIAAPDVPQLTGDDAIIAQQWMAQVLQPFLDKHRKNRPCWLNLTGGTKATSLALSSGYAWAGIDYKPAGKNYLSSYQINLKQAPGAEVFTSLGEKPLPPVTPQQVACIYNKSFEEKSPNPFRKHPYSTQLAEDIFMGLDRQDEGLLDLFNALTRIWSDERDKKISSLVKIQPDLALERFFPQYGCLASRNMVTVPGKFCTEGVFCLRR